MQQARCRSGQQTLSAAVQPESGQRGQTTWMQTTGVSLLVVKRCSLPYVRVPAQDSRRAHGLLYLAAVRGGVAGMPVKCQLAPKLGGADG
jgi:hypothetical protein